jgi:hypothetical protein
MRAAFTLPLLAVLLVPALAHADDEDAPFHVEGMTAAAAGQKACDAVLAIADGPSESPKCKKVTSKKVKGLGTATAYLVTDKLKEISRYVLVIDDGSGALVLSPPADLVAEDCAMMKCDVMKKASVKIRATQIDGQPAVALDIDASMSHEMTDPDDGKSAGKTPWHRRVIEACSNSTGWNCAVTDLGSSYASCTASIDAGGILTYSCPQEVQLSFAGTGSGQ